MRVLVTGAGGFLGSHVIPDLLARGHKVVAQDVLAPDSATRLRDVIGRIEYRWKSVVDVDADSLRGFDYVLHFAALTDVPLANSSPRYTYQLNLDAAMSLLLAVREAKVPLLAMSTENVYGKVPEERLPAKEDEPLRPKNSYAASKVAVEALAHAWAFQYGLDVSFIRSSTLFGEAMRPKQVVAIFCRQAVDGFPITIEGDGSQTRDFNYVSNMTDAIGRVLEKQPKGFNVWNIGSGKEMSLKQLIDTVMDIAHSTSKIEYRPWRPGEEGRLCISIEKATRELEYRPSVTVEEGLRRLIAWMVTR